MLLEIGNGMSSTMSVERTTIKTIGRVRDVKFVDDEELMLAVSTRCKHASDMVLVRRLD